MSDIYVTTRRRDRLLKEMDRLGVLESDLIEKFVEGCFVIGQSSLQRPATHAKQVKFQILMN